MTLIYVRDAWDPCGIHDYDYQFTLVRWTEITLSTDRTVKLTLHLYVEARHITYTCDVDYGLVR